MTTKETTASTALGAPQHAILEFTTEKVQRILSLIETPTEGYEKLSGNVTWLFGTGTSRHKTGVYEVLENVRSIDDTTASTWWRCSKSKSFPQRLGLSIVLCSLKIY